MCDTRHLTCVQMKRIHTDQQEIDRVAEVYNACPSGRGNRPVWCQGLHSSRQCFLFRDSPAWRLAPGRLPHQLGLAPKIRCKEGLGPPSPFPVPAGDLFCSNDAGIARRQTTSIRRSQSPQVNSDERRIAAMWSESAATMLQAALVTDIGSSYRFPPNEVSSTALAVS